MLVYCVLNYVVKTFKGTTSQHYATIWSICFSHVNFSSCFQSQELTFAHLIATNSHCNNGSLLDQQGLGWIPDR